jgi:hypothetical protein
LLEESEEREAGSSKKESLRCRSTVGQGSNEIEEAEKQTLEREQHRRKDEGKRENPVFAGGGKAKTKTNEKTQNLKINEKTHPKPDNKDEKQTSFREGWKGDPAKKISASIFVRKYQT